MPRSGPGKLPVEIVRKGPLLDQLHFFFEAKKALTARLLELGTDDPLRPALIEVIESYDARLVEIMAELKARNGLPPSKQGGNVNKMNAAAHALATSGGKSDDALIKMANKHGYTLRRLAHEARISPATLSRARRGERSLKREIADKIEELVGFKATAANWPGGLT